MTTNIYLAIDPGKGGGLAMLEGDRVVTTRMPPDDAELLHWIRSHKGAPGQRCQSALEKVGGYIARTEGGLTGRERHTGSAMFQFGLNVGLCRMALVACGLKPLEVRPQDWQAGLGLFPRDKAAKETRTAFKARLRAMASRLFPGLRVTLLVADALLIAEYLRRLNEGGLVSRRSFGGPRKVPRQSGK
jgi:hypothetical protein